MNIPLLRFSDFDGEWDRKQLGDLLESIHSGKDSNDSNGTYPLYGSMGIIGKSFYPTYTGKHILVARVGANAGTINLVEDMFGVTDNTLVIENGKSLDTDYEYYLLTVANLNRYVFGSGQPLVTGSLLKALKVNIPTLPEQQKIASFFTAIDQKLTQLKKKKDLLEEYKKGVMQKIFSQEIRFKDDNGQEFPKWEKKELGEIGEFKNGINKGKEDFGFGFPFINLMNVFGKPTISCLNLDLVNATKKELELYKLEKGDVLFIRSSVKRTGVGETSLVMEDLKNTVFSGFLIRFRDNKIRLSLNFKKYCFSTTTFRKDLISLSTTSANTNINQESLVELQIRIPCIKEQIKIADSLSAIDDKIYHTQMQIEKAEVWKKGLLQQMFV